MKNNTAYVLVLSLMLTFFGGLAVMDHWEKVEKENNAFAAECNKRSGEAKFEINARQCIGAKQDQTNG